MTVEQLRDALIDCWNRQSSTTPPGIKLRGSLDAQQHEWLQAAIRDMANNFAMAFAVDEGDCGMCGAGFGEGTCPTCGAGSARHP